MKSHKGFTITELIIVIFVIAIAVGVAIPNFGCRPRGSRQYAREAEVKSNIHSIQIALERYAIDTGGMYPLILYGGDPDDTFTTYKSHVLNPPIDEPAYQNFPGDMDALLEFGYLAQYPQNPFVTRRDRGIEGKIITNSADNGFGPLEINPGRVNIWAQPRDRGTEYIRRQVGGPYGNLMWDVSEGQRHAPWPIMLVPEPEPGPLGYTNPKLGGIKVTKSITRESYQFPLTQGNFYYYALFDGGCYSQFLDVNGDGVGEVEFPVMGMVIGFKLSGYGEIQNPGVDYYNLYGDYSERSLFTINDPDQPGGGIADLYVGPDGIRDGVIIVVSSGVDMKYG